MNIKLAMSIQSLAKNVDLGYGFFDLFHRKKIILTEEDILFSRNTHFSTNTSDLSSAVELVMIFQEKLLLLKKDTNYIFTDLK